MHDVVSIMAARFYRRGEFSNGRRYFYLFTRELYPYVATSPQRDPYVVSIPTRIARSR